MTPRPPRKPRSVKVEDELWHAAQRRADERGENVSEVIREALKRYVREQVMSDQRFHPGGYIPGPPMTVRVQRVDDCHNGHPLFSIDSGPDEHIISAVDMREGRGPAMLACQREVDERRV